MGIKSIAKTIVQWRKEKDIIPITHPVSEKNLFNEKVALIVGGSGGIGLAIARSLLESGCKVVIAGTNQSKLESLTNELGNHTKFIILNMKNIDLFDEAVEKAVSQFGRIDILINSAGVHTENLDFWSMTPEEYDRVLDINLKGPYFLSIAIAQYMIRENIKGHILFVTSSRGSEPAWSPYGLSKWGLNGMIKGLAQMFISYEIVVNGIAPGSTATPLLGKNENDSIYTTENCMNRMITPDEIATISKMLVSSSGDMIIGDIIHVSGGRGTIDIR